MGVIEKIKEGMDLIKKTIGLQQEEITKLNHNIQYYKGHYDGMSTALQIINDTDSCASVIAKEKRGT